ncbi:MAG TPA: hypothetical protein VJB57_16500 [Dehalococcoidia bacterium]|nr:hypothetical protein [Dehalococcoidia bacterium]
MAEATGEIDCPYCGKTGRAQTAPTGDARFCPHCGAEINDADRFLRITAPGIDIEMRPSGTRTNVDVDELASGAVTATGLAFGGPIGLVVGLMGALLGGVTGRQSEEHGLPAAPLRPSFVRTIAVIGLSTVLVIGFVASPGGLIFLSPALGVFLLGAAYLAYRMRR